MLILCKRCNGGEIPAPNCPGCGGSGWTEDGVRSSLEASAAGAVLSREARHRLIEYRRREREAEKHRKVRVRATAGRPEAEAKPETLSPAEKKRREEAMERQRRRLAQQERRRRRLSRMTPLQFKEEEERQRRERQRSYSSAPDPSDLSPQVQQRSPSKPKACRGSQAPAKLGKQPPETRLSREEQSARTVVNDQLGSQLSALLSSSGNEDDTTLQVNTPTAPARASERRPAPGAKTFRPEKGKAKRQQASRGPGPADTPLIPIGDAPEDPYAEVRGEFRTGVPSWDREEDAGRYMGHSFREADGQFGSLPMYDDYDD